MRGLRRRGWCAYTDAMTITAIVAGDIGTGVIKGQGDGRTTVIIDSATARRAEPGDSDAGGNDGVGSDTAGDGIAVGAMTGRRRGGVVSPDGWCRAMFTGSEQTRKGDA